MSFTRRRLVNQLEARRDATIAALWANMNYDGQGEEEESDEDPPRAQAIRELEAQCQEAVDFIWRKSLGKRTQEEQEMEESEFSSDIDYNNPFWAGMQRGLAKLEQPRNEEGIVRDNI